MANQEKRTTIGGQALIEGIMMRGPYKQAIAVRDQKGEIVLTTEELKFIKDKYPVLGWPLIRGVVNFGGSMVAGVKALMYSASFYPEEEEAQTGKVRAVAQQAYQFGKAGVSHYLFCGCIRDLVLCRAVHVAADFVGGTD